MELEELYKLRNFNEYDLCKKIIEISSKNLNIAEKSLKGNKAAGIEFRKVLTDIKFLVMVSREKIQSRKNSDRKLKRGTYLERHIAKELKIREEEDKIIL